ncbi:zinc-binding alcohol dehydrogenase family protein [Candidatus Sumerlaeota bacterium]|nr:zinc-binding alcohol dehydrogenase family protein [Candidatus Sumerlaeota bacterium]
MKAFFIHEPGKVGFGEIPKPSPAPGEVLLKVRNCGYCGSDLTAYRGANPMVTFPIIPGHEVAATIEEVAPGVPETFRVGMNATVSPYTTCGVCSACRQGRTNCCRDNLTYGVRRDGLMTEYFTSPWEKLVVADRLSLRELALVEPLSVGFHAVDRAQATHRDVVGVFGCGAIGLGAISGAAFRNATVVAIDIDDKKLEVGRRAGAAHTINSSRESLHERLAELTGGEGPDVLIEAVGLPQTFRAAVDEACFAGRVVYIGYAKDEVAYNTRQFVQKELDVRGSRNAMAHDFRDVVRMLEAGRFPVEDVLTAVVPFDRAGDILKRWSADPLAFMKIQVEM